MFAWGEKGFNLYTIVFAKFDSLDIEWFDLVLPGFLPVLGAVARLALLDTVNPNTRSSFTLLVLESFEVLTTVDGSASKKTEDILSALLTCFLFPPSFS